MGLDSEGGRSQVVVLTSNGTEGRVTMATSRVSSFVSDVAHRNFTATKLSQGPGISRRPLY